MMTLGRERETVLLYLRATSPGSRSCSEMASRLRMEERAVDDALNALMQEGEIAAMRPMHQSEPIRFRALKPSTWYDWRRDWQQRAREQ